MTDDNKYIQNLNEIIKAAEEVAGQWNGDNPGIAEDRAGIANEIIQKANEIKELINAL